ncbi:MAG TPA: hypothetical protein VF518_02405, partial [Polyangia bacterium]
YTYFNVQVLLNQSGSNWVETKTQISISSCDLYVLYNGRRIEEPTKLRTLQGAEACRPGKTGKLPDSQGGGDDPNGVGTADYSTAKTSGKLKFIVDMVTPVPTDAQGNSTVTIVQGSAEGDASPGNVLYLELVTAKCDFSACPIDQLCKPTCPDDTSKL